MSESKRARSAEPDNSLYSKKKKTDEESHKLDDMEHFGSFSEVLTSTANSPFSSPEDTVCSLPSAGEDIDPLNAVGDKHPPQNDEKQADRSLLMGMGRYKRLREKLPLHFAITTMPMSTLAPFLNRKLAASSPTDPQWTARDHRGNTILHAAALECHLGCITWIQNNLGTILDDTRNDRGCTALEELKSHLDDTREFTQVGSSRVDISDKFRGFSEHLIMCNLTLQRKGTGFSAEDALKAKYGCTCGECIEGFISPRILYELHVHAEEIYIKYQEYENDSWFTSAIDRDPFISPVIKSRWKEDQRWKEGYFEIFNCIPECLNDHQIPTDTGVLRMLDKRLQNDKAYLGLGFDYLTKEESIAKARYFLGKEGKVVDVLRVVFGSVNYKDPESETGRGLYNVDMEDFLECYGPMPNCRNDFEPGFVAAMCGVEDFQDIREAFNRDCLLGQIFG